MLQAAVRTLSNVYRSWRLHATIELTLDWDGPLIYTVGVGEPPLTRAVRCRVASARRRSLTLVSGRVEVRFPAFTDRGARGWTAWTEVAPLERFVALPWTVPAGDEADAAIPTASLASRLAGAAFPTEIAELRIVAFDGRQAAYPSPPLLLAKIDLMPA